MHLSACQVQKCDCYFAHWPIPWVFPNKSVLKTGSVPIIRYEDSYSVGHHWKS